MAVDCQPISEARLLLVQAQEKLGLIVQAAGDVMGADRAAAMESERGRAFGQC
jgi:hypothetical protein